MKKTSSKRLHSGLTLIEILVTMFVMSIGLMGLAALQATSIKQSMDTSTRSQGLWLVEEMIARMRSNEDGLASSYTIAAAAMKSRHKSLCIPALS